MTQEVLKLALEALKEAQTNDDGMEKWDRNKKAITAIKEALREHAMREVQRLGQEIEQEPIGTVKELFTQTAWERLDLRGSTKVYLNTTPPQRTWVGLTEEEKSELWEISRAAWPRYITYASLAEAKLKEKNT